MKHVIVGTAGHIDHGKTALIKALTGINTDRLQEEQQRGITIDLGFAFLPLSHDIELGIIDVPGHERFVKNMLAGIGGIDLAILVVAADEGVMPQTEEHLAICDLLKIQKGLVALTKIDLVDEEWCQMVMEDVRAEMMGTFLEDAPIIPVSSKTGEGVESLVTELQTLAMQVHERGIDGVFRLPIDRVFTIKGFGTVVTGTLISGAVKTEDVVEVLPQQIKVRVRNIQVHDTDVPMASAGQRTALNLHGIEKQLLQRGDVLAEQTLLTPTYMLDAYLALLPKAARPLKNRSRVRIHHGTREVLGRVIFFDREELAPGENTYVQLRLEAPLVALARDRYIIRSYSPVITIGGGEFVFVRPEKHKRSPNLLASLQILHQGTLYDILEYYAKHMRFEPLTPRKVAGMLAVPEHEIAAAFQHLRQQGIVVDILTDTPAVIHSVHYRRLEESILQALDEFHKKFPLKTGVSKEELRRKMPLNLSPVVFDQVIVGQIAD